MFSLRLPKGMLATRVAASFPMAGEKSAGTGPRSQLRRGHGHRPGTMRRVRRTVGASATQTAVRRVSTRSAIGRALLAATLSLVFAALWAGSAQGASLFQFEAYWGAGSFSGPEALAVDQSTGDIYVLERNAGCVARFHGNRGPGAFTPDDFPASGNNKLCGLAFDGPSGSQVAIDNSGTSTEGTIYISSPFTGGVNSYDSEGNPIGVIPSHNGGEQCGVATDGDGNLYIGVYYGGIDKYQHHDPISDENYVTTFSAGGICEVAGSSNGDEYASYYANGPLVKYPAGFPGPAFPSFVFDEASFSPYVDPVSNDLYVDEGDEVAAFTEEGKLFDRFGGGTISESRGVAIDHQTDTVYAVDGPNNRVAAFHGTPAHGLGVNVAGTGLGSVSADSGALEGCGEEGSCSGYYAPGPVVLKATPQTHSVVDSWNGCESVSAGGDECDVTVGATDIEVEVTFTRLQHQLTVSTAGTGEGSVSNTEGIGLVKNCGAVGGICSGPYDEGSLVSLTATPVGHSSFTGWSGGCTNNSGPCMIPLEAAATVTANFTQQHSIAVSKSGTGAGSVVSQPQSLSCGGTCLAYFTDGESVILEPVASGNSSFSGWSGACAGTGACEITVGTDVSVTAAFAHEKPNAATEAGVTFLGQHAGTVHGSVDPNGAEVSDCQVEYGQSSAYGSVTPCVPSNVGSGDSPVEIGANLTNLIAGTTYHYRVVAANVGGTAAGVDQTFSTRADTCDTNPALCPPAEEHPRTASCRKGYVLRKGNCVKKHHRKHKRATHRHHRRGATR